jgi:murein DD-endopeptidase MepM/ murein hydrolase activator NlpD
MELAAQKNIKRKRRMSAIILAILLFCAAAAAYLYFFKRPEPLPPLPQVEAPEGAQLLICPIQDGFITAGFGNEEYLEKNGYGHYGIDMSAVGVSEVLSLGNGVALGTESCDNSLGNIAVIRFDNVYIPHSGEAVSLIARYYHLLAATVKTGDKVVAGQILGTIDATHKWYNHVHVELDSDLGRPFNTPQVAEASSELLNRWPADGSSMIEPLDAMALGKGQDIYTHPARK